MRKRRYRVRIKWITSGPRTLKYLSNDKALQDFLNAEARAAGIAAFFVDDTQAPGEVRIIAGDLASSYTIKRVSC